MGARVSRDFQWRFPIEDSVPNKIKLATLAFEDQYFYYHFGFNPISIFKALIQNLKEQKIVRGASTISQQVIRIQRKNKKRTVFEKIIELLLSINLELFNSKKTILKYYVSLAPYGGNTVGIGAASWRYFKKKPSELTWGESATLAVLPNSPSLIYPGRNSFSLKNKRNKLLLKMRDLEIITHGQYSLAILEDIPQKPNKIPVISEHLCERVKREYEGEKIRTSIQISFQKQLNQIIQRHYEINKMSEIFTYVLWLLIIKLAKL